MNTAILLIIFNRPVTTEKVFNAIRLAKPPKLYISADGTREGNEEDKINCYKARETVQRIDWNCEVKYRFLDKNIGCGWGPASAITWAFENEEKLIILEDDCIPSISFFNYCDYFLKKYETDTRIWLISGRSHQQGSKFFEKKDYIFTHYGHSWGWATWKRCWSHFDMYMRDFPQFLENGGAINILSSKKEGKFYNKLFLEKYSDKELSTHAWDFQFGYAIIKNDGLCIVPAKNLIENIGYLGTHSISKNKFHTMKAYDDFTFEKEPLFINVDRNYELLHFKKHIKKNLGKKSWYKRIINKSFKLIGIR